ESRHDPLHSGRIVRRLRCDRSVDCLLKRLDSAFAVHRPPPQGLASRTLLAYPDPSPRGPPLGTRSGSPTTLPWSSSAPPHRYRTLTTSTRRDSPPTLGRSIHTSPRRIGPAH